MIYSGLERWVRYSKIFFFLHNSTQHITILIEWNLKKKIFLFYFYFGSLIKIHSDRRTSRKQKIFYPFSLLHHPYQLIRNVDVFIQNEFKGLSYAKEIWNKSSWLEDGKWFKFTELNLLWILDSKNSRQIIFLPEESNRTKSN